MDTKLNHILSLCRPLTVQGHTAAYIPELALRDPDCLGLYIVSPETGDQSAGDCFETFTMQSVVKPMILLLAEWRLFEILSVWKPPENLSMPSITATRP